MCQLAQTVTNACTSIIVSSSVLLDRYSRHHTRMRHTLSSSYSTHGVRPERDLLPHNHTNHILITLSTCIYIHRANAASTSTHSMSHISTCRCCDGGRLFCATVALGDHASPPLRYVVKSLTHFVVKGGDELSTGMLMLDVLASMIVHTCVSTNTTCGGFMYVGHTT